MKNTSLNKLKDNNPFRSLLLRFTDYFEKEQGLAPLFFLLPTLWQEWNHNLAGK